MTRQRWPLVLAMRANAALDWSLVLGWAIASAVLLELYLAVPVAALGVVLRRHTWGRWCFHRQLHLFRLLSATDRLRERERHVTTRVGRGEKPEDLYHEYVRWRDDQGEPPAEAMRAARVAINRLTRSRPNTICVRCRTAYQVEDGHACPPEAA